VTVGTALPRVVVSNLYADDNRGGAAITLATMQWIEDALGPCYLTGITLAADPSEHARTHRHTLAARDVDLVVGPYQGARGPAARILALLRSVLVLATAGRVGADEALRRVLGAALVVGKGGQAFSPRREGRALLGFWYAMLPLLLARRVGVPTALYSITVGPYTEGSSAERLARYVLRRVDLVCVRDSRSLVEVLRLGVPQDAVRLVPDSVFALPPPSPEVMAATRTRLGLAGRSYVAVTVLLADPSSPTFPVLVRATRRLLAEELVEEVVVPLQTDGPTTSDRPGSVWFVEQVGDPRVRLIDEDLGVDELMALYGGAVAVVGTRVHSTIFAAVAGTTPVPLVFARMSKAQDIFDHAGLGEFPVQLHSPVDPAAADVIVERVRQAVAAGADRRRYIRDRVESAPGYADSLAALRALLGIGAGDRDLRH
jgi:colanic acid/amylovoran biosynthesis protein